MGKAWDAGREWKGMDVTEYCDSLSLEACDIDTGRGAAVLFCCGELVMMGGRGGWLGFDVGETAGGEVAGDEVADMIVDMFARGRVVSGQFACDVAEAIAPVSYVS